MATSFRSGAGWSMRTRSLGWHHPAQGQTSRI
jgi:hypothetical protein